MEKFFIVTKESKLYEYYLNYKNNRKLMFSISTKFMLDNGIEATQYCDTSECFYIIPSQNDKINFAKMLSKTKYHNGLIAFNKNSKIGKAWTNLLKEQQIKIIRKPMVQFYFNGYGKSRSRLFDVDDVIYCSFECESSFDNPIGMIEIKASEFYKVIENEK